jgi:SAM-dependent methyltransferase
VSFDFQEAYDELNPSHDDYRFYAALAHELDATRVLDLGCGTGVLARILASGGHTVVGIDPDPDMLRVARGKPGADQVDWRLGYSDSAGTGSVDLAVMTGHVAQVFIEDEDWHTVLTHLHRALAPGGTLAFETRNPGAKGWEAWTREATLRTVPTEAGRVEFWHETVEVDLPRVAYDTFTRNLDTGEASRTRNRLAFRDHDTLRASLSDAGFEIVTVLGDWSKRPLVDASPEIVVVAGRRQN